MIGEFLAVADIETAYEFAIEVQRSRDWMLIPFFGLVFSIIIPSSLRLAEKVNERQMRRMLVYFAAAFFGYAAIMIGVMIGDMPNHDIVEQKINDHVDSLDCNELLEFIFYYKTEQPRYMYEDRQLVVEEKFYSECSSMVGR